MTDNGSAYESWLFRNTRKESSIRTHQRTRPYTPRTNGKAERFIQTSLREWLYARAYETSEQRATELPRWLHRYNGIALMAISDQSHRSADCLAGTTS